MKWLFKLVDGKYSLPATYWGWMSGAAALFSSLMILLAGLSIERIPGANPLTAVLIYLYTLYFPLSLIGTWRSASHYQGWPVWAGLAKASILLLFLFWLMVALLAGLAAPPPV